MIPQISLIIDVVGIPIWPTSCASHLFPHTSYMTLNFYKFKRQKSGERQRFWETSAEPSGS